MPSIKCSQTFITLSFSSICLSRVWRRSQMVVEIFIYFLVISTPRFLSATSDQRFLIMVSERFISWRSLLYSAQKRIIFCSMFSDILIHSSFWACNCPSILSSSIWYSSCMVLKELTNSSITFNVSSTVLLFCSLATMACLSCSLSLLSLSRSCCSQMTWCASCSISCWLMCGKLSTWELLNSSIDSVSSVLMLISYYRERFRVLFYQQSSRFCCRRSQMSAEKSDYF